MKKSLYIFTASVLCAFAATAEPVTIKQWDFNSEVGDFQPTTGTYKPLIGGGSPAQAVGGVGDRFGTMTNPSGDDNTADNSMWRIGSNLGNDSFPAATNANKTAGAQFFVNTSGYNNIRVFWNQENSATASKYWRVQYTTNGADWLDHSTVITAISVDANGLETGTPVWQTGLSADFTATPGADDNSNFGFRLVSEFESTATGAGTNAYVANRSGNNYTTGGTIWLDIVTITGDAVNLGNERPQISVISDTTVLVSNTIPPFAVTVSDTETLAGDLILSAINFNTNLISGLSLGGSGADRTLTVTPVPGKLGTGAITVRATDADGKSAESSFFLTIVEPLISSIPFQSTVSNAPVIVNFSVSHLPGDPANWVLSGLSSNTNVVRSSDIVFSGTDSNRSATINVVPNASGETTITITATSEGRFATTNFNLRQLAGFILRYNLTGLPNSNPPATTPATTVATGLTAAPLSRGAGIAPAGLGHGFSANNWNNITSATNPVSATRDNAILHGEYFQFAFTVSASHSASLESLDVSMRRSALDAPRNFEWLYSFDDFATAGKTLTNFTYLGRSSGTAGSPTPFQWMTTDTAGQDAGNPISTIYLYGISDFQNIAAGSTVTFRLYGWGRDSNPGADSNTVALGRTNGPAIRGTITSVAPINPPTIQASIVGNSISLSWPGTDTGFTVEATGSLSPTNWQATAEQPSGTNTSVSIPVSGNARFFRLKK